jgi:hypothetical protein
MSDKAIKREDDTMRRMIQMAPKPHPKPPSAKKKPKKKGRET